MMTFAIVFVSLFSAGQVPDRPDDVDPKVFAILTTMEDAGRDVHDLKCSMQYRVTDQLNFESFVKYGNIVFVRDEPNPRFMVHFDKRVQDERVNRDREWWLFDGHWLWEVTDDGETPQIIQREVVCPGEQVDFFNLETAPFPVPFGQNRAQILEHFDVKLVEPKPKDPAATDHLMCVPKPSSRLAEDYDSLEFFVSRDLRLPVRIIATEKKALKVVYSDFPDLSAPNINTGLNAKDLKKPSEWERFGTPWIERLDGCANDP